MACARIGFVLGGMRIALASTAVLVTMGGFLQAAHFIVVDTALVAFVALSWWALVEYQEGKRNIYLILVWVFAAGSFLSKGIIGIGLTFPGMSVYLLWLHGWRQVFSPWHIAGLMAFSGILAIWLVPLYRYNGGELFRYWLFHENLGRFLGSTHVHHSEGPFFYIKQFFLITLPWSPWLLVQIVNRVGHWKKKMTRLEILSFCWAGIGLILLSFPDNKRYLYACPLLPPAALLLAAFLGNRKQLVGSRIWSLGWTYLTLIAVPAMMLAYLFDLADYPSPWFSFIAGSLVAVTGLLSIRRLLGHPGELGIPAFWIAPCLLFVQFAVLYVPAAESVVSHRPGMLKIADLLDPDSTPAFYRPDETILGSFSFYTGRRVILIEKKKDLKGHMSKHPNTIILVRKKRWPFRMAPNELGQLLKGSIQVGRDRHIFVLRIDSPIKLRSLFRGKDE